MRRVVLVAAVLTVIVVASAWGQTSVSDSTCVTPGAGVVVDLAYFKTQFWVPILLALGFLLKRQPRFPNGAIPVAVWGLAIVGEFLGTKMTGGQVTKWTYMSGAAWGAGIVGVHSSGKNAWQLLKLLVRGKAIEEGSDAS